MMKADFIVRTDRKLSQGFPIFLYIRDTNTRLRFYTGVFISNASYLKDNKVSKKDALWREKNDRLTLLLSEVNIILLKQYSSPIMKEEIEELLGHKTSTKKKLVDYLREYADSRKEKRTKESYYNTIRKIEGFDKDVAVNVIDVKWLNSFVRHCSKTMSVNGYFGHLKNLRAVFNYLIEENITDNYPFKMFKIRMEATVHRALTIEQVRSITSCKCPPFMEKYRDIFMLMLYLMGINSKDLLYLTGENMVEGRLEYHRYKTGKLYSIKVEPEADVLIRKHKGKKYLLNFMDSYKDHLDCLHHINDNLKKIGMGYVAGTGYSGTPICPKLTTYYARHTWASLAFEIGIPKDTISLALGHSMGVKVTDIYIKYDLQKIDEANRKVIDYITKTSQLHSQEGKK